MEAVTRFAPSPTGYLHAGHAFSALFAAKAGQRFLLRIEDIDPQRCRPEFEKAIYEDLAWLGLHWECPVRCQSDHFPDYRKALESLEQRGLLYPCFCTRADIARAGGAPQGDYGPQYPGTCKHLSEPERAERKATSPHALRLDVDMALKQINRPLRWHDRAKGWQETRREYLDDVVLARTLRGTNTAAQVLPASYHLCVTHDDALQGITLVTRGEDLFTSTHIHCLLQNLMGWDTPDYHHHALLADSHGKRLAKRDNAPALRELREQGLTPAQIMANFQGLLS